MQQGRKLFVRRFAKWREGGLVGVSVSLAENVCVLTSIGGIWNGC